MVEASSVTKGTSLVVFAFCVFAMVLYATTGFMAVHPFVSVVVGFAASIFYFIGRMIGERENDNNLG